MTDTSSLNHRHVRWLAGVSISQARRNGMTIDRVPVTGLQRAYAQLQGRSGGATT